MSTRDLYNSSQQIGSSQSIGTQQDDGTQVTGQPDTPATQTTDANQAIGGANNAGVKTTDDTLSDNGAAGTNADGTAKPVGNGTTVVNTDGTTVTNTDETTKPVGNGTTVVNTDGTNQADGNRAADTNADGTAKPVGNGTTVVHGGESRPYLADWSKDDFTSVMQKGDKPISAYISDYNRWADATGHEPLDVFTMMNAIKGNDIGSSYQANQQAAKRLERRQRWQQIGNVLAHLGNFVGTLSGAPSGNYESADGLTKRQQAVKDAIEKQRGDPKNILAMIWKDRADQRARELNNANIALQGARKANVEGQTVNQKAQSDANVALKGAQQRQANTAADVNEAQTGYINGKNQREQELQPLRKKNIQSSTNANNARANASNASAQKTRLETSTKSRQEQEDADFEALYNDPVGKKYIDAYAKNNNLNVGSNAGYGRGGNWSNPKNRRAAVRWARYKMNHRQNYSGFSIHKKK